MKMTENFCCYGPVISNSHNTVPRTTAEHIHGRSTGHCASVHKREKCLIWKDINNIIMVLYDFVFWSHVDQKFFFNIIPF